MAGSVTEDYKALYGIIPSAVLLLRDDELLFARVSLKWLPAIQRRRCRSRQTERKMADAMSWMVELHIGVHNEACWTGFHMTT